MLLTLKYKTANFEVTI